MKRNEKKQKLGITKFQIAKIKKPKYVIGGNGTTGFGDNDGTNGYGDDDDDVRTGTISE